jgi:serine-type D-Ala-D-Ala carboxypeptidase/endopeptidase
MKKLALLALALVLVSTAPVGAAAAPDSLADQVAHIVQPQLDKYQDLNLTAVVGIVETGSKGALLSHIFYYGKVVDQNGSPLTLNGATEFEIGSVTKTFSAMIFASLLKHQPSLFELSTNRIFPQTPSFMGKQETTLGDLSNYTSGLPDSNRGAGNDTCTFSGGSITDCFDVDLALGNLSDPALSALQFAPGSAFLYSDLGYALLALAEPILAELVKKNHGIRLLYGWEQMLDSIVLGPLGMNSTHAFNPVIDPPLLPMGYRHESAKKIVTALDHNTSWPAYIGAGGIVSTPDDMMLYLEYNLGLLHSGLNSLLPVLHSPTTTVRTGAGEQIGLSWFIGNLDLGSSSIPFISKNGGVPAFATQIDFAPSTTTGVVVFTNASADKGVEELFDVQKTAYEVLQIINGAAPTGPPDTGDQP